MGIFVLALMAAQVSLAGMATAANQAANIDQCANGAVGPPVVLESCAGNNWINGNVNGQKAHWQEGDFISYRATLTHLIAGAHTLDIHWDVVHGGKHAIDYLGSFDATETTSSTASALHANNNDPCGDVLSSGCTPSSPQESAPVGAFTPANCGGSAGTFSGSQVAGSIKLFGNALDTGAGATFAYLNENVAAGQGQCSSFGRISFTTTGSDQTVVIAWGGHIASQADWGTGNSASGISGSPYHMALDFLDGASTGAQDRALSTSAILFVTSITTTLVPASPVTVGTSVHDTATLSGFTPGAGGSVFYRYYSSVADCQADVAAFNGTSGSLTHGTDAGTGTVTNGVAGNSNSIAFNSAGSFFWAAFYSGDNTDSPSSSDCTSEPLVVNPASPTLTTVPSPGSGNIGDLLTDSATLSGGFNPTGTITFYLFAPGTCDTGEGLGGAVYTSTVTVSGNSPPDYLSSDGQATGDNTALQAGVYDWAAIYSGDNNNNGAMSGCGAESVTIAKNPTKLTTNASPDSGQVGNLLKDSAILKGATVDAGGHINFYLFAPGVTCRADGTGSVYRSTNVAVSGPGTYHSTAGTESGDNTAKRAGTYHWLAVYTGDANNTGTNSGCGTEPVVIKAPPPAQPPPIHPPVPVTG